MNDEHDIIMRQVKSFAQGLGAMLAKEGGDQDEATIVFADGEVDLTPYKAALRQEISTNDFLSATHLLESWRAARISKNQYERLFSWLQEQRFGLEES